MDDMQSKMQEMKDHMKGHIEYPASKDDIMKACNMMSDVPDEDKKYMEDKLPAGTYQSAEEVENALMPTA